MNNSFLLIIWQPVNKYFDDILNSANNIGKINNTYHLNIKDETLLDFIYKIYEKDSKFEKLKKKGLLKEKYKSLKNNSEVILIIDINIQNPTFNHKNSCLEIVNFKKTIRDKYKSYTKDFNNIIHGCDSINDSNNVRNFLLRIK